MKCSAIPYSQLSIFPKLIRDYLEGTPQIKSFYNYPFDFTAFKDVISDKNLSKENRQILVDELNKQYARINTTASVKSNISKLLETNSFTVTTAHQPVLFTGPLYVVYKIISAIHIAEKLRGAFPGNHFIPVYCMGAEDHDFEEINHIRLNGEKLEWKEEKGGAVGRLSTKNILPLIDEVENRLHGKPLVNESIRLLRESYTGHSTLAESTLDLVDSLFGKRGLVVLNPDNRNLKKIFTPVIERELLENNSFHLAEQTNKELSALGYDIQVNPREINLFYHGENLRERIVLNPQTKEYEVLNTNLSFNKEEILKTVREFPERFSPNVMLRPLYQETILPNIAYVGGAGELSYWLQQKRIFEHYGINFPMLVLRNSAMVVDSGTIKKMNKAGIELKELFEKEEKLVQSFIKKNSGNASGFETEREEAEKMFEGIKQKATSVDITLASAIEAQKATFLKGLEGIETKIMRAQKRNFETSINQLRGVKAKLFPGNILQERMENPLPYYAQYGDVFFETLKNEFNPFRKEFLFFQE